MIRVEVKLCSDCDPILCPLAKMAGLKVGRALSTGGEVEEKIECDKGEGYMIMGETPPKKEAIGFSEN